MDLIQIVVTDKNRNQYIRSWRIDVPVKDAIRCTITDEDIERYIDINSIINITVIGGK